MIIVRELTIIFWKKDIKIIRLNNLPVDSIIHRESIKAKMEKYSEDIY